jgi:hypothetical protein
MRTCLNSLAVRHRTVEIPSILIKGDFEAVLLRASPTVPSFSSYRVHTTPLSPLNPPPVGDFSKPIMSSKSPRMGDLGGEKVCNELISTCVYTVAFSRGARRIKKRLHPQQDAFQTGSEAIPLLSLEII